MQVKVDTQALTVSWESREGGRVSVGCRIGRGGAVEAADKREGDGATPKGVYPLRFGMWRADRLARPPSALPFHPIVEDDLWCDDPGHAAYNRWVAAPFSGRHERLWREDCAYDLLLVMGHNDSPPVPGLGSAVFVHLDRPDLRDTLGCVAVEPEAMVRLLREVGPGWEVVIR